MSNEVLIRAEGVSKKFCRSLKRSLWYGVQDVTAEMLGRKGRHDNLRKNEFWAVDDVSFDLRRGECLGLIGPNGAGKSTLLKMLNGLVKPDKGRITMRGRVGALIELGAGFNPILTARENIYVNGSVLGLGKKEIDRKFDAIVDFAGIQDFVDTPVQNYSSGMKVRLGFAVAGQLEPDILLIDEVLAVGDAQFKTKCIAQMADLSPSAALVLVSHSMPLIGRMSDKAMVIAKGRSLIATFDVASNIKEYNKLSCSSHEFIFGKENAEILSVAVSDQGSFSPGKSFDVQRLSEICITFTINLRKDLGDCLLNAVFFDEEQKGVAESFSSDQGFYISNAKGEVNIRLQLNQLELNSGQYSLALSIIERLRSDQRGRVYFSHRGVLTLVVSGPSIGYAPVQLASTWQCV